jgi:uncharacterized lipoprotein YddW (UPF0748 family)
LKLFFTLFIILICTNLFAQVQRETRAVWVSTNYRLDWPPNTNDEERQKQDLIKIFDTIEKKNLNTIYFQIRSNGTVLFRSSQEIFSPYITGELGKFGNYDPLQFAVEEAHKRGMEIHAVVNTMRIFSGNEAVVKNSPLHISQIYREWVYSKSDDNSIWLNPGIPAVRKYLVDLINEIVQNYNVDGIQLDFIRYPPAPISDKKSYDTFGEGKTISDWRRGNITEFIKVLYGKIKQTNPKIKLGVTPLGIYKSIHNGSGMEGFNDVYQDTREWLRLGIIDYAVPQIYWDARSNPKFDVVAKDWIENSYDKNIIIGIGAYKPEVLNEIEREINITRKLNSSGMAFFRYKNIERKQFYSFNEKTLPSEMPWLESVPEIVNLNLIASNDNTKITLRFDIDEKNKSDNGYFALYQNSKTTSNELIKVIPNYTSEIGFSITQPDKINYYYSATQFDQLWNATSNTSDIAKVSIPKLKKTEDNIEVIKNPILLQKGSRSVLLIFSNIDEEISLYSSENQNENSFLSKHFLKKGFNEVNLNNDLRNFKKIVIIFSSSNKSVSL